VPYDNGYGSFFLHVASFDYLLQSVCLVVLACCDDCRYYVEDVYKKDHGIYLVKFSMTSLLDYKMRTQNLHTRCVNHRTHICVMTCDHHSTWA
jgi:hypothetical protein